MRSFLRDYLKDFSWVAAGMGGALIIDFFFYILAGRLMTPIEYGYFGVVTSLYYIFLRTPFSLIETVSRKIASDGTDPTEILGKATVLSGLLMFTLFLVLSDQISALISVPSSLVAVFSMVFPAGYFLAVLVGKVQGEQRFHLYGKYEFLSTLISFSMIGLVYLGFGAEAAASMFVVEIAAGALVLFNGDSFSIGSGSFEEFELLKNSLAYTLGVYSAFSLDVLAVNHLFSGQVTGYYSAVAVLGKGVFFGSIAVNRSVFPKFVSEEDDRKKNLLLSLGLVLLGGGSASLFFRLFGTEFMSAVFGSGYSQAAIYAPFYMVMITGISSLALLSNYFISTDRKSVRAVVLLPIVQIVFILLNGSTVIEVMESTLVASSLFLLFLTYRLIRRN